jgi:hypothetical protein
MLQRTQSAFERQNSQLFMIIQSRSTRLLPVSSRRQTNLAPFLLLDTTLVGLGKGADANMDLDEQVFISIVPLKLWSDLASILES